MLLCKVKIIERPEIDSTKVYAVREEVEARRKIKEEFFQDYGIYNKGQTKEKVEAEREMKKILGGYESGKKILEDKTGRISDKQMETIKKISTPIGREKFLKNILDTREANKQK